MKNINPTSTAAWKALADHYKTAKNFNLKEAFQNNPDRAKELTIQEGDFYVDLSKNLILKETQDKLVDLANECHLTEAIESYFNGKKINVTENRAVLHTALRSNDISTQVGENVTAAIESKKKMFAFVDAVNNGEITAANGKKFDTVVNIGIGGSDLGPEMIYEAMQAYKNELTLHFVSNIEGDHVEETLKKIQPATTLFVIVSKSFGTQETLTNSTTIRNWFTDKVSASAIAKHFIAVSSNVQRAVDFGIDKENIFPMFDWVGGRFSLWSTVGMSVALGIGSKKFQGLMVLMIWTPISGTPLLIKTFLSS
jgi:glucose-6-phosphate isomerase